MGRARSRLTVTAAAAVAVLLSSMIVAYAAGGTGTVVPPPRVALVAHGVNPADALAAGPIASQIGAPIFTTSPNGLSDGAEDGLVAYAPEIVIVVGGAGALPDAILDEIRAATGLVGDDVRRVFGDDRYKTAQALSTMLADEGFTTAFLPVDATAMGALDADDSDTLDGLDSTDFVRGPIRIAHAHGDWTPTTVSTEGGPFNPIRLRRGVGATSVESQDTSLADVVVTMPLTRPADDGTPSTGTPLLSRNSFGLLTDLRVCYYVEDAADPIVRVRLVAMDLGEPFGNDVLLDAVVDWNSTGPTCAAVPLPENGLVAINPVQLTLTYAPQAEGLDNQLYLLGTTSTWDVSNTSLTVSLAPDGS